MELEEAIREIKLWTEAYKEVRFLDFYDKRYLRAIDTVLAELDRLNKRIEYALDFAVDYDGYYNPETKQGNAEGLAMTIDDMVDVLKGKMKGVG